MLSSVIEYVALDVETVSCFHAPYRCLNRTEAEAVRGCIGRCTFPWLKRCKEYTRKRQTCLGACWFRSCKYLLKYDGFKWKICKKIQLFRSVCLLSIFRYPLPQWTLRVPITRIVCFLVRFSVHYLLFCIRDI